MTAPVDVRGILERAGADSDAPEGSQAWALAQVDAAVAELIEADREYDAAFKAALGMIENGYEQDSYGVPGSEFCRCLACDAESGAGVLNKGLTHQAGCVVHRFEIAEERRKAVLARVGGEA